MITSNLEATQNEATRLKLSVPNLKLAELLWSPLPAGVPLADKANTAVFLSTQKPRLHDDTGTSV